MTAVVPVITIDGPSGSGKGTIAGLLARRLGWGLLDSGALYRLLALAAEWHQIALSDEPQLTKLAAQLDVRFQAATETSPQRIFLENREVADAIRNEQVGAWASQVAAVPAVRAALLQRQKSFQTPPGLVAVGRIRGRFVFPESPWKFFLTASAEERAHRRYLQLKEKSPDVTLASLIEDIRARDLRDTQRAVAPLVAASDAIVLDSTTQSIQQVLGQVLAEVQKRALANVGLD